MRSPSTLRSMYEISTGSNTALIIDFAPFPNGTLPAAQVAAATSLGKYIRGCYDTPAVATNSSGTLTLTLTVPAAVTGIDRVVVAEDQRYGQLIRVFSVTAVLRNGTSVTLANGSSVGNKFISIQLQDVPAASVTLQVTRIAAGSPSGAPYIRNFAVYTGCNALGEQLDAEWVLAGHAVSVDDAVAPLVGQHASIKPWSHPRR